MVAKVLVRDGVEFGLSSKALSTSRTEHAFGSFSKPFFLGGLLALQQQQQQQLLRGRQAVFVSRKRSWQDAAAPGPAACCVDAVGFFSWE